MHKYYKLSLILHCSSSPPADGLGQHGGSGLWNYPMLSPGQCLLVATSVVLDLQLRTRVRNRRNLVIKGDCTTNRLVPSGGLHTFPNSHCCYALPRVAWQWWWPYFVVGQMQTTISSCALTVDFSLFAHWFHRGNYGRQPYKAGPQCSQCPEEAPFCVEGLCSKTTTSATEADTEGRGNPQQGTRNDETLTVQIPAQVTLEVRHRPVENRPAPQPTPNKVVLIKPHQNNVQRPAPQAQTQRSSQTPEKTSVSTEQTVRSSQQSRNSVRFAAHLETKRFVTKFSNGDISKYCQSQLAARAKRVCL